MTTLCPLTDQLDPLPHLLQELLPLEGHTLVRNYHDRWTAFDRAADYLDRLFEHHNRHWVARERADGEYAVNDVRVVRPA